LHDFVVMVIRLCMTPHCMNISVTYRDGQL